MTTAGKSALRRYYSNQAERARRVWGCSGGGRYLDGGVGLPVLLAGGSWEAAMRRALAAVPEPETTLGGGGTGHMTTSAADPAVAAAAR